MYAQVGEQRLWDDYVEPDTLACWIRTDAQEPSFTFAVVDVRDTDLRGKRTGQQPPLPASMPVSTMVYPSLPVHLGSYYVYAVVCLDN